MPKPPEYDLAAQVSSAIDGLREGDDVSTAQHALAAAARTFADQLTTAGKATAAEEFRAEYGSLHVHLATCTGRRILTPLGALKKQAEFLLQRFREVS